MKPVLFAVSILFAASLACGSQQGTATQYAIEPNTSSPAPNAAATEALPSTSAPTVVPQNTTSGPNLELTAYLQKSEDIGNGQKRVTVALDGKNASNGWYSYYVISSSLQTKEGFTYPPAPDTASDYASKSSSLAPPGSIFSWTGQDLSNDQGWWGRIGFNIPLEATPNEITIAYGSNAVDLTYAVGSVTTPILPISEARKADNPFDNRYAGTLKLVKAGGQVSFGDLATFTFTVSDAQPDGSFEIRLNIISIDQGYPLSLKPSLVRNYTYILYQDGTSCCGHSAYDWIQDLNFVLGPQQTMRLPAKDAVVIVPNPHHLKVWLVGDFTLVETNGGSKADSEQFVVELPNSPNTSSQTAVTPGVSAVTPAVSNIRMTKDQAGKTVTSTYSPSETFYVFADLGGLSQGSVVEAKWYAVSVQGVDPNTLLNTSTYTYESGVANVYFQLTTSDGSPWPTGTYKVELYVDRAKVGEQSFTVK